MLSQFALEKGLFLASWTHLPVNWKEQNRDEKEDQVIAQCIAKSSMRLFVYVLDVSKARKQFTTTKIQYIAQNNLFDGFTYKTGEHFA